MSTSGSSSYVVIGWSDPPNRILKYWLDRTIQEGLEKFDVSSAEGLRDYWTYLADKIGSGGTHYFIFRKHSDTRSASVFVFRLQFVLLADNRISIHTL